MWLDKLKDGSLLGRRTAFHHNVLRHVLETNRYILLSDLCTRQQQWLRWFWRFPFDRGWFVKLHSDTLRLVDLRLAECPSSYVELLEDAVYFSIVRCLLLLALLHLFNVANTVLMILHRQLTLQNLAASFAHFDSLHLCAVIVDRLRSRELFRLCYELQVFRADEVIVEHIHA